MRLLPRSRRGTWLLAALAWLAACAALWSALPVVPRAKWNAPRPCRLMGLLFDSTLATQDLPSSGPFFSGPVRLWNPETGAAVSSEPLWRNEQVVITIVSSDGQGILAVVNGVPPDRPKFEVKYYTHSTRREISVTSSTSIENASVGWMPAISPDGRMLAVHQALFDSNSNKQFAREWIEIWECNPPRLRCTLDGASVPMTFSPDGRFLATGSVHIGDVRESPGLRSTESALVWDAATGKRVYEFKPSAFYIQSLTFETSSRRLAVMGRPADQSLSRITLLDWQSGGEEGTFDGVENLIALQRVSNGRWSLNRWDRTNKCFRYHGTRLLQSEQPADHQISPDGRIFATCMGIVGKSIHPSLRPMLVWLGLGGYADIPASEEIVLSDSESWQDIGRIPGINEVVFHPNGKTAFAVRNREIQIWDIPPRRPLSWFAAGAALLALPIALVARRRCRSFPQSESVL